jgi:hypothetical protein
MSSRISSIKLTPKLPPHVRASPYRGVKTHPPARKITTLQGKPEATNMNTRGLIWASLIGLACATCASAEEANSNAAPLIIGVIDPQTGIIKPLMTTAATPEVAPASALITGELKITGTITIVSPSIGATTRGVQRDGRTGDGPERTHYRIGHEHRDSVGRNGHLHGAGALRVVAAERGFRSGHFERQRICAADRSACSHAAARVVHCACKWRNDLVYVRRAPVTLGAALF